MPDVDLKPCDIVATKSKGRLGRLIRFFTKRFGESRSNCNHVGIITHGGKIQESIIVEAQSVVLHQRLQQGYGGKTAPDLAVFRPLNLTDEDQETISRAAESYVGRKYGYFKLLAHLGDWLLQGAYVFRRIARSDKYPICSWVVAQAYARAKKDFGVNPGAASPDDIWDFCVAHPNKYAVIIPLGNLDSFRKAEA